ncbi:uncharacterized protein [Paramisgurnus dabryanus]|uniref:uncharacterized protein n=1 Tax=Paramisgurnus dabryanus TaxID=90735 RepID=UPI0031F370EE
MIICLYISLFIIHFTTGCNLSNEQKRIEVTQYTGGSVLLACSCDDPKSTVNTFTWDIYNGKQWMNVFEHDTFKGRLKLFIEKSPGNLSLLIPDLREEDKGLFRCMTEPNSFTDVSLTVQGCHLVQTQIDEVTGYLGESVVLPCSCTEPLAKPDKIKWKFYIKKENYEEIYPSEHSERYKNRCKLLNQTNPGNLSLQLSSLTKEDVGYYQCFLSSVKFAQVKLYVEEKPQVHIMYSSTYQPLQQTHELTQQPENKITHQTHNTTLYVFILIAAFASILIFLVFNSCRGEGDKHTKVESDAPEPAREPENEDEAVFSGVFYVNQHLNI